MYEMLPDIRLFDFITQLTESFSFELLFLTIYLWLSVYEDKLRFGTALDVMT